MAQSGHSRSDGKRCVLRQTIQFLALMAVISTCSAVPADDFSIDRSPQGEDNLIDGTVAREWGDFIRAKDIRINCRTVRSVVRNVPRPEDYFTKCDLNTEFDHPYAAFTDEQLEQIANHDWEAAYLLAYRLLMQPSPEKKRDENPQTGLSYAMNALVNTGEPQIFELMIKGRHFNNWIVWATVNGVPNERQIGEKSEEYLWYKVGRNLGYIENDDHQWRRLTGIMKRFESYFDIDELNSQAARISDGVAKRRSMITGE